MKEALYFPVKLGRILIVASMQLPNLRFEARSVRVDVAVALGEFCYILLC